MAGPRESLTTLYDFPESLSVIRILRDWFTEVPSLTGPIIDCQRNMMGGDGAGDRWPTSLDGLHGGTGRGVLEHDP